MNDFNKFMHEFVFADWEKGSEFDKWGIDFRYHPQAESDDFTLEDALAIYEQEYWLFFGCDHLHFPLNVLVMDFGITSGSDGVLSLQRSLNKASNLIIPLAVDGKIGPLTIQASRRAIDEVTIPLMLLDRMDYYRTLANNYEKYREFFRGWCNRVYALRDYISK